MAGVSVPKKACRVIAEGMDGASGPESVQGPAPAMVRRIVLEFHFNLTLVKSRTNKVRSLERSKPRYEPFMYAHQTQ